MTGDKTEGQKNGVAASIGVVAGKTPSEIFARTGQGVLLLGIFALLGIDVSGALGVSVGEHTVAAPYICIIIGVTLMGIGSQLDLRDGKCQK